MEKQAIQAQVFAEQQVVASLKDQISQLKEAIKHDRAESDQRKVDYQQTES